MTVGWWCLGVGVGLAVYSYLLYPGLVAVIGWIRPAPGRPKAPDEWPIVSITVPVYNEAAHIRAKLEKILQWDYPADRRQVLVVSDASTDDTDRIVREFAARGVELVRLPQRGGKTAAENAALPHLKGSIVVNSDASIDVPPDSLKALVIWFGDPTVGVASCRDVSVSSVAAETNQGESGYVGYEMGVRRLETRAGGIVGASGCFYAIRIHLHQHLVPEALSRDFAAPLVARRYGFRSVSVEEAVAFVPRTTSLRREYSRKVRTMTRGLETLFFHRGLLNPFRYGLFAWELWSHKLIRWLVPWGGLLALAGLALLAPGAVWARALLIVGGLAVLAGAAGWWWPAERRLPRVLSIPTYALAGNIAAIHAWISALRGDLNPIWEPTRRPAAMPGTSNSSNAPGVGSRTLR
jgi:cellulose synthase/poly-beta-1,6-N-acetylglucosamine synthase-like glycosyltransferase